MFLANDVLSHLDYQRLAPSQNGCHNLPRIEVRVQPTTTVRKTSGVSPQSKYGEGLATSQITQYNQFRRRSQLALKLMQLIVTLYTRNVLHVRSAFRSYVIMHSCAHPAWKYAWSQCCALQQYVCTYSLQTTHPTQHVFTSLWITQF